MKASELRIGNWHLDYKKKPAQIQAMDILAISQCEVANTTVEFAFPIPLTDQWLFKFGFKSVGKLHPTYKFKHLIIEASLMRDHYVLRQILNKEDSLALNQNLQYVHQLQNLFYALTGEELTIKP